MRLLASFAMGGRWQAILMAAVLAIFSFVIPLLGFVSAAVVALVTLRQGMREGLFVAASAALASAGAVAALTGTSGPALGLLALLWLPVWLVAGLLRGTRSLSLSVQAAILAGVAMIAGHYAQFSDPVGQWRTVLGPFADALVEAQVIPAPQRNGLVDLVAPWMTGILAAVSYWQLIAALLLARWWQACLYNPGGFRREFHALHFHRYLAYASVPFIGLLLVPDGAERVLAMSYVAMLLTAAYFVQGLALMHGLVAGMGAGVGWLVAMYVLLVLAMPQLIVALAAAGYADAWFDFRARFRGKGGLE